MLRSPFYECRTIQPFMDLLGSSRILFTPGPGTDTITKTIAPKSLQKTRHPTWMLLQSGQKSRRYSSLLNVLCCRCSKPTQKPHGLQPLRAVNLPKDSDDHSSVASRQPGEAKTTFVTCTKFEQTRVQTGEDPHTEPG